MPPSVSSRDEWFSSASAKWLDRNIDRHSSIGQSSMTIQEGEAVDGIFVPRRRSSCLVTPTTWSPSRAAVRAEPVKVGSSPCSAMSRSQDGSKHDLAGPSRGVGSKRLQKTGPDPAKQTASSDLKSPATEAVLRRRRDTWIGKKAIVQDYISNLHNLSRTSLNVDGVYEAPSQDKFETEISGEGFTLVRRKTRSSRGGRPPGVSQQSHPSPVEKIRASSQAGPALTPRRSSILQRMLSTIGTLRLAAGNNEQLSLPTTPQQTAQGPLNGTDRRMRSMHRHHGSGGSGGSAHSTFRSLSDTLAAFPNPPTSMTSMTVPSGSNDTPDFGPQWGESHHKLYASLTVHSGLRSLPLGTSAVSWAVIELKGRVYRPADYAIVEGRRGIDLVVVIDLSARTSPGSLTNSIRYVRYLYQSLQQEDRLAIAVVASFEDSRTGEEELRIGVGLQPVSAWKIENLLARLGRWKADQDSPPANIGRVMKFALKLFNDPEVAKVARFEEGKYLFSKHVIVLSPSNQLELEPLADLDDVQLHHVSSSCVRRSSPMRDAYVWCISPFSTPPSGQQDPGFDSDGIEQMLASLRSGQDLGQLHDLDIRSLPAPSCQILGTIGTMKALDLGPGETIRRAIRIRTGPSTTPRCSPRRGSSYQSASNNDLLRQLDLMLGEAVTETATIEAEYTHDFLPPSTRLLTRREVQVTRMLGTPQSRVTQMSQGFPASSSRSQLSSTTYHLRRRVTGEPISPTTIRHRRESSPYEFSTRHSPYATQPKSYEVSDLEPERPGHADDQDDCVMDETTMMQLIYQLSESMSPRQALCAIDHLTRNFELSEASSRIAEDLRNELLHHIDLRRRFGQVSDVTETELHGQTASEIVELLDSDTSNALAIASAQDEIHSLASPASSWERGILPPGSVQSPTSGVRSPDLQEGVMRVATARQESDEASKLWDYLEIETRGHPYLEAESSAFWSPSRAHPNHTEASSGSRATDEVENRVVEPLSIKRLPLSTQRRRLEVDRRALGDIGGHDVRRNHVP